MTPESVTWAAKHRNILAAIALLLVVLIVVLATSRDRSTRQDAMAVMQCVSLYAEAKTAAESSLVDAVHPIQGLTEETTCQTLRRDGRLSR